MIKMLMMFVASLFMSVASLAATKTVVLSDKNTVIMRYAFTDESVSKVIVELLQKSAALPPNEPLYLFMDTPGGSVTAGMDLIQAVKGLGREVKTITAFAASMGFMTVQNLGERIIMPYGVLMSHRASGGVQGQIPGEIDTRYVFWKTYLKRMASDVAERLDMSVEEYEAKHWNEWWISGEDAVSEDVADTLANVKCDGSMSGVTKETVSTLFGPLNVTWSKCPLVKAPLSVTMANIKFTTMSDSEKKGYLEAVSAYFYNKQEFLRDYIITGKYNRIFN